MVKAGRATASELPGYEELKSYHFTLGACQPTERNGKSLADSDHSILLRAVEGLLRPDRAVRRIRDIRPGAVCKTSLAQPQPHQDRRRALELAYRRAPFFEALAPTVRSWYERADKEKRLTDVNALFLREIANLLGLGTRIVRDTDYPSHGGKTERLLGIARAAGADRYLSGPSARAYFDEAAFTAAGVAVEWMSYEGYPEYPQLHGKFEHKVSVLDVLFSTGPDAPRYCHARAA